MRGGAACAPALEAIETVNAVTNSMDAQQGVAGSASINGDSPVGGGKNYYNRHVQDGTQVADALA